MGILVKLDKARELMSNDLLITVENQVATVTFNRPQQRNAINLAMWQGLPTLCQQLDDDAAIRVVIWRGAGDAAFSAGGDISEFAALRSNRDQAEAYNATVDAALTRILQLRKPTIALIKGYCMGGGLMLAAHCDLRIAAANAQFGIPVANLGALITYTEMQRFIHVMGVAATTELLLTGRLYDVREAQTVGLCTQVYPLDMIDEQVQKLTARMAKLAPFSQQWHKAMLQTLLHKPDINAITSEELARVNACFDSADYQEGTLAFLEKRAPNFQGK